ncbi:MAG: endonuclease/exonuclease/phosphatase family protein [Chloroflexi bacterium]|nr:endonuclease/exonuclease/phosphatase family protein [Chloroflexota bacterium]
MFRVALLNLYQGFTRWDERRHLVVEGVLALKPDVLVLNEISIPVQSGHWLQATLKENGREYALLQQSKTGALSQAEAQGILTTAPIVASENFDYRSRDRVAQVATLRLDGRLVDVWATHLHHVSEEDGLRQYQVQKLLGWIHDRPGPSATVVAGDFNATPDSMTVQLMRNAGFSPTQTQPTSRTALAEVGEARMDADGPSLKWCIDYIWADARIAVTDTGLWADKPHPEDPKLWPSDHVGVWADLQVTG